MQQRPLLILAGFVLLAAGLPASEDLLIADFERRDYGAWKATGEAFGTGPARGTLPNQMDVSGFLGTGLVNSYVGGDKTTGTLTSPPFTIQRNYLNFLVGGGMHPGKTCMNLLLDGKTVRTVTGPNDRPGGSEALDWHAWDVSPFKGKTVVLQIMDRATGGWGHINIDHIYQSDTKVEVPGPKTRTFTLRSAYLNLPVKNGATKRTVTLSLAGKKVREFVIELADVEVDFWVYLDVRRFRDKKADLTIDTYSPTRTRGFDAVFQADTFPGQDRLYKERLRPQFHFSSRRGWNNDPNGMVYFDGEYHLFWQHNPFGRNWGNMTWGHAVSTDMLHWKELGDAIHPDHLGTIFSGSAVVDTHNTTGFQAGDVPPIVCIYTSAGGTNPWSKGQPFTQSLAYSTDRGRTWKVYEGNPVQKHINGSNRDPKVIWYEPLKQWVIVLYLDGHRMGFFTSEDLKSWKLNSELKCFHECPELFELPLDGKSTNKKWILYGASGHYHVGSFDGTTFTPDGTAIRFHYGNCFYASQTFNNIPEEDGRRIQIAWGQVTIPDMPFNQMMDFPVELTLKTTEDGPRMFARPIREITTLHGKHESWKNVTLEPGKNILSKVKGELFHLVADIALGDAREVGFDVRGTRIVYNVTAKQLSCQDRKAPLAPLGGIIKLEVLVDKASVEIFANDGRIYMPMRAIHPSDNTSLGIFSTGGNARIVALNCFEMQSAWE